MYTNKTHQENPDFFDICELFNDYITNDNKKFNL